VVLNNAVYTNQHYIIDKTCKFILNMHFWG